MRATESLVVRACRGERVERTPVWFMRQAGRYMASYRALRESHAMLDLCSHPELAAEVTCQPVQALGVDAAIVFSDILLPFVPLGLDLSYVEGKGPVIGRPIRSVTDVNNLPSVNAVESVGYVADAVRMVRAELSSELALIGFAGGPFTMASYAIEGGSSRAQLLTKSFMYREPEAWHRLLGIFGTIAADLLVMQIEAGAGVIQLFDSWAGCLSPDDYAEYVLPHARRIFDRVRHTGVPAIHFGVGTGGMLEMLREAGADVVGVDWRIPLDVARARLGPNVAVQGNLDPAVLQAPPNVIRDHTADVLRRNAGRPGHVFNLGHGIPPTTPVENVQRVVDLVRALTEGRVTTHAG